MIIICRNTKHVILHEKCYKNTAWYTSQRFQWDFLTSKAPKYAYGNQGKHFWGHVFWGSYSYYKEWINKLRNSIIAYIM